MISWSGYLSAMISKSERATFKVVFPSENDMNVGSLTAAYKLN